MDVGTRAASSGARSLLPLGKAFLLGAAVACSGSCGTVLTFSDGFQETDSVLSPKPFGGTRLDVRGISVVLDQGFPWALLSVAFALDLPLSAAADLVTLPLTVPLHLTRPREPAPAIAPDDPDRPPLLPKAESDPGPVDSGASPSEVDVLPAAWGAGSPA